MALLGPRCVLVLGPSLRTHVLPATSHNRSLNTQRLLLVKKPLSCQKHLPHGSTPWLSFSSPPFTTSLKCHSEPFPTPLQVQHSMSLWSLFGSVPHTDASPLALCAECWSFGDEMGQALGCRGSRSLSPAGPSLEELRYKDMEDAMVVESSVHLTLTWALQRML